MNKNSDVQKIRLRDRLDFGKYAGTKVMYICESVDGRTYLRHLQSLPKFELAEAVTVLMDKYEALQAKSGQTDLVAVSITPTQIDESNTKNYHVG